MAVNIMIQGTMSNAGKSLIAAGLCRVFYQDGYRVAPFKSQNMALNSCVTEEGLEMGRAQAVQAEACGKKPSVLMNPVLLKPTTDVGSQVIVLGQVRSNMKAADYFKYKKKLVPEILEAYDRLASENDIIVIEGAGSPAEINLKSEDIVNMGLAELVDAPVLLVGDIDRGGVFAQLAGTVMLLEDREKERIRGMIINKFRGDVSILEPGLRMIEEICDKPVIGVVPYEQIDIEDEDSLSEKLGKNVFYNAEEEEEQAYIDIAVIRLPRISNFTDFDALAAAGGARVRYADAPAELAGADIIVLPGTKSTIADLQWLRRAGLAAEITRRARQGAAVIGICGGYQMLGSSIADESCAESENPLRLAGLGLLPVDTVFREEKTLGLTSGKTAEQEKNGIFSSLSKLEIHGYEIHMGTSVIDQKYSDRCRPFLRLEDGRTDGCVFGNVLGTYLHGVFDSAEFTENLLRSVAVKKGIDPDSFRAADRQTYKEEQYDRLADVIRKSLDMEKIYEIMGLERR